MAIALWITLGIIAGGALGFYIGTRRPLTMKLYEKIASYSQHAVYMYMISDEMYRVRFNKWAKSHQGQQYMEAVMENLGGHLFLLPLEDKEQLESIIKDIYTIGE